MDFDLLGSLGWREGLIAIIALLLGYIVLLFLRLRRLQRERSGALTSTAKSAVASYAAVQEPLQAPNPAPAEAEPEPLKPLPGEASAQPQAPLTVSEAEIAWSAVPPEIPGQAMIDALQQELYQLRCEVDELRVEVLAAREDVRHQLAQSVGSAPPPSPQYTDAMQMAAQGHDATAIAHHCSISRAEADLVVALARNRQDLNKLERG